MYLFIQIEIARLEIHDALVRPPCFFFWSNATNQLLFRKDINSLPVSHSWLLHD